jgi:hypothetical protein
MAGGSHLPIQRIPKKPCPAKAMSFETPHLRGEGRGGGILKSGTQLCSTMTVTSDSLLFTQAEEDFNRNCDQQRQEDLTETATSKGRRQWFWLM